MRVHLYTSFFALAATLFAQAGAYPASRHGGNYMFNYYLPPAPSTTPWAPCWSPDGKAIAVGMYGSIWKIDPHTGKAIELTYGPKYHSAPNWSPDGKWIIYTADDDGKSIQLEILNVETGKSRALTSDHHVYADPVFSPDGSKVAYVSTRPNGYFNIYVRSIQSGDWAGEEIALTSDNRYPRDRLYFGAWDMHTQPAWSRDGKDILFVSNRGVPLGSGHLWKMPVEANGISQAKPILQEQTLYRTRSAVSIDGKRIIYSSSAGAADQFNQLYVIPVEGGAPYKLTFGNFDRFHPRWSPDGEWVAYISNEGGLPQLAMLETYGGAQQTVRITERRWKRPMGKLHVRVVDENGNTTPARIHAIAADGKFYPPPESYARIGASQRHLFHTTGEFTAELPPGKVDVEALKGFEFVPAKATAEILPGGAAQLVMTLRRLADMPAKGWYSGSTHVHMNYAGNLHNTLENLMMMSRAESQNMLNSLTANKDNRIFDWQFFVPGGGEHPISKNDPNLKVVIGEEYRPPFYGHIFLIGLKNNLISPFTTGYEGTGIESLYPSNTDMFRKARAQGAIVGYVHPYTGEKDPLDGNLGVAKAFPVDVALRTIDGIEWSTAGRAQLRVWHHALNNDLVAAPTGGEDSITNLHIGKLIASVRTYAHVGPKLTAEGWMDAVRRGHTFFSSGPLLEFQINGRLPGDVVKLPPEGGTITLEGSVQSITPLSQILIHHNGQVLKELPANAPANFKETLRVTASGWYSLYAEGPKHPHLDANFAQASTNAIRVYVGDQKIRNRESAEYFVRWMDKLRGMAEAWPWWRSEAEKKHVFAQFDEARAIYQRLATE